MTRKTLDCRSTPSETNCTLTISGAEDEVLTAGVQHAVDAHGHADEPALREGLRGELVDAPDGASSAGAFAQLIEFETDRIDELDDIQDRVVAALGTDRTTRWSVITADRDRPDSYVMVVEFPDHERAMRNSAHPATAVFAEELAKICTAGPRFRNLDVRRARSY